MNRFAVVSSLVNALSALAVQVAALLLLSPAQYGEFSLRFLLFALGLSLCYSLITDVWARNRHADDPVDYGGALLWFTLALAVIAIAVLLLLGTGPAGSLIFGGAVAAAVYRFGVRYAASHRDAWRQVVVADALGLVVFVVLVVLLSTAGIDRFVAVALAWLTSSIAALVASAPLAVGGPARLTRWIARHRRQIAGLWVDTALLDLSNVGGPAILYPLMPSASFGVYRGVSSAAAPVRLVLAPLRAQLGRQTTGWFRTTRTLAGSIGLAVALAAVVGVGVVVVGGIPAASATILPHLVPFAGAAALFTAASCVSYFFYLGARAHLATSRLRAGRIFESVVMLIGPLLGFVIAGLPGAVWGYALGATVNAVRWVALMRSSTGAA